MDITTLVLAKKHAVEAANKSMVVQIRGTRIRCAWKYSNAQDMWLDFDTLGPNGIRMMYDVWKVPNSGSRVSTNLDNPAAAYFYNIRSDTVGPYVMKANGGANNGYSGFSFSGGIHAFDGSSNMPFTPGVAPSATPVSIVVYADGVRVLDGDLVVCNQIDIEVVNDIMGYNTTARNGFATPRGILRETIHYTVTPGSVEVSADCQALEALTIERYYGIQNVASSVWKKIHYVNGQQSGYTDINTSVASSDSGLKSANPNVDRFVYSDAGRANFCVAWMDNTYGLGTRANVAATEKLAFSTNIPKTYFSLVYSSNLVLTAGQVVSWRGGYVWTESLPCPGADLAYTLREGGKQKYVVDFLAASTGTLVATKQNDRNKQTAVDNASSGVTVPSRVGSTGVNITATGYGQAKFTV